MMRHDLSLAFALVLAASAAVFAQTPSDGAGGLLRPRAQVMVVGAYHFVSKANVRNMDVDDPLTPKRQAEIAELVEHLTAFRPTKVILEQTSGTSGLEESYQSFLADGFELPPSENYQIGFRLAKALGLRRIHLTNARTDFDFESVLASAKAHGQDDLMEAADDLYNDFERVPSLLLKHGTVLDMFRYFNSEEAIRANNSGYMLLARVGDDADFAGAKLVASWYLRNVEMFAQMTRIVTSSDERVLILYGQGHAYLLRDFIRASPDLQLVDAAAYLR